MTEHSAEIDGVRCYSCGHHYAARPDQIETVCPECGSDSFARVGAERHAEKDALATLSKKATPGLWRQESYRDGEMLADGTGSMDDYETPGTGVFVIDEDSAEGYCLTEFNAGREADAAFIVAAVNYVRDHVLPPASGVSDA